ncbi:hypothetical protein L3Q82_003863 [Scortum barcoo]|uniref:Uncharacterized protein n=1 Tax=Scortum barcoo TaxID=214431 RepID=A0ACB8X642_9TELE|nr:hypothetical protein L3Q82_003863 [Scortum barcoo]
MFNRSAEMVFVQDGAPAHTAHTTQQWCSEQLPGFLHKEEWPWPPNSPYLNPIENCWGRGILNSRIFHSPSPTTMKQLNARAVEWSNTEPSFLKNLVHTMPDRLKGTVCADMLSTLHCFGFSVVLFSLAPFILAYSHGAGHASCREMTPGHIRAQPQAPMHSHVTLSASASSYLPGQLVTVTVRSSRDFMGFLLQARSVEGVRSRGSTGSGSGVRSARLGPVLVGGSWALTPPGTHTLRCLSEGDTLTHSDKQLKRNLSFVWKAPDSPMGDIKFYITVVQSYFVHWEGIESAVVCDGSHSHWGNITGTDEGNSIFAPLEDEVTALPALGAHSALDKQPIETNATTLKPLKTTTNEIKSYKSQEIITEVTHQVLEMNSSSASLGRSDEVVSEGKSLMPLGSPQNASKGSETDNYATSDSFSGVTEEAEPSPVPRRSFYNLLTSTPMPSRQFTWGKKFIIQNHIASSDAEPKLNPPTLGAVVHHNPEPHPNLDPNFKQNLGHNLKPNLPNTDTKPKRPFKPSGSPDKEGKYPDIIPRHSAWELGMLLGCSAGLGMVLVVGVRYMYRQACGKRTEVTLNDREREYGRGERGLIQVQECGDLVRVRRIRENSFVLLADSSSDWL